MRQMLIAYDLDGTLIDSLGSTLDLLVAAVKAVTGREMHPEQISRHFGLPEERALLRSLDGDEKITDLVMDHYVASFQKNREKINFFPDVATGLTRLKAAIEKTAPGRKKASLALYTARGRRSTEVLFSHLQMDRWFQNWITGSDVSEGKPHPEGFLFLSRQAALNGGARTVNSHTMENQEAKTAIPIVNAGDLGRFSDSFYIGDSPKDILLAKAVGAIAIGVTWCQHCDKTALAQVAPDFIFDQPRELFDFLIARVEAR